MRSLFFTLVLLTLSMLSMLGAQARAQSGLTADVVPNLNDPLRVYMQVNAVTTGTTAFGALTHYFQPFGAVAAGEDTYTEVCIDIATAGPVGSTVDVDLYDTDPSTGLPNNRMWQSDAFDNTSVSLQCKTFASDGVWDSGAAANDGSDNLRIGYSKVVWVKVQKSAGVNSWHTVPLAAARVLGANPAGHGAPTTGLTVANGNLSNPINPSNLAISSGQVPWVGMR